MTKDEIIEKYGQIKIKFCDYWKYEFCFSGQMANIKISAYLGGDGGDIYRIDIDGKEHVLSEHPCLAYFKYISVTDNGVDIGEWDEQND